MLEYLKAKVSDRKLRLFACACCRRIWPLLTDERSRRSVERAEHYAEGQLAREQLAAASQAALAVVLATEETTVPAQSAATAAVWAARWHGDTPTEAAWHAAWYASAEASQAVLRDEGLPVEWAEARAIQAALLRCLFGNPLHPMVLDPAWLTWHDGLIRQLAQAAYDERHLPSGYLGPDRLAVLADALEESGCQDQNILAHLRSPGPHTRGCHIVDLLLGRE
jgi:hypothetical protein